MFSENPTMEHVDESCLDWSVSAVITVYNPDPAYLTKAIQSVLEQSLQVKELLLVNDGGSEAFRNLIPDDARIRVFSKPNGGVATSRNYAIRNCVGEYIAFLDQDDFWYPDKLREQTAMIPIKGEPCMVTSSIDVVDVEGRVIKSKSENFREGYQRMIFSGELIKGLVDDNFIFSSTPLIHKSVFAGVGGFDAQTQPHDDWDMYIRIALSGYSIYCHFGKPLSVWRVHDANESNKRKAMVESRCLVSRKILSSVTDPEIRKILQANMSLDLLEIDALLYKGHCCREYRSILPRHVMDALGIFILSRRSDCFAYDYRKRFLSKVLKSLRRYLISFFLREGIRRSSRKI